MFKLSEKRCEIATAILGLSVAVILWMTVFKRDGGISDSLRYQPFQSFVTSWDDIKRRGIRGNFLGNILIFLPIGVLYPLSFGRNINSSAKKLGGTIIFGLCLSMLVELTQLLSARGYFDIDDIVLNSLGTGTGYCFYQLTKLFLSIRKKKHDRTSA